MSLYLYICHIRISAWGWMSVFGAHRTTAKLTKKEEEEAAEKEEGAKKFWRASGFAEGTACFSPAVKQYRIRCERSDDTEQKTRRHIPMPQWLGHSLFSIRHMEKAQRDFFFRKYKSTASWRKVNEPRSCFLPHWSCSKIQKQITTNKRCK